MNPGPAVSYRKVDQTQAVDHAKVDHQRGLPKETVKANNVAWNVSNTNTENQNDGVHRNVEIAEI